uniref:Phosphatidylinositol-specific phospholipase C X domain-containing protein n=1 Tax=Fundulus heteroclitus TaxID=8078 RepID=A0A3Q2NU65_FUNHE
MEMGDNLGGGNPDWMSRLPEDLLDVPLWNLAIPGSHDSMAFCLDVSSPVLGSEIFEQLGLDLNNFATCLKN